MIDKEEDILTANEQRLPRLSFHDFVHLNLLIPQFLFHIDSYLILVPCSVDFIERNGDAQVMMFMDKGP